MRRTACWGCGNDTAERNSNDELVTVGWLRIVHLVQPGRTEQQFYCSGKCLVETVQRQDFNVHGEFLSRE